MTTCKVKRETANLFQNNDTPERYLEKCLSNIRGAKQKEFGIWLDYGTIIPELKIKKFHLSSGKQQIQQTQKKRGKS